MKIYLLSISLMLAGTATALACRGGDRHVSSYYTNESQSCTFSGYCTAYGLNPANGLYEYYYGYHSSCSGRQARQVEQRTCETRDGFQYTETHPGSWGTCS